MNTRWCALAGALAVLLVSPAAPASSPPDSAQVRADLLATEVLAVHPDLAALQAAVAEAGHRQQLAGALPDPRLDLAFAPDTVGGYIAPGGNPRSLATSVRLSQRFPWPGTLRLAKNGAQQDRLAQQEALADQRLEMAALTRAAYARWVFLHQALDINQRSLDLLADLRAVSERRYGSGLDGQQDVLRIAIQSAARERARLHLEHRRHEVRAQLNALRQRAPDAPLAPPARWAPAVDLPPLSALNRLALSNHPRLRAAEARVDGARVDSLLAAKDFFPDFELSVGHSEMQIVPEVRTTLGASLNLPFGQGKRRAAQDAAEAAVAGAQSVLASRRSELLSRLEQAYAKAVDADRAIALIDTRWLPRSREALAASRGLFAAGGGDFRTVIEAEEALLEAELERARSAADGFVARAWITRWSGATNEESP